MRWKTLLPVLACLPMLLFAKGDPPLDNSRAGTDGPYVFYKGANKIVVKSVETRDTQVVVNTKVYAHRSDIILNCSVPESDDYFSFGLHDSLPIPAWDYPLPDRMLVLSDIEGNFQAFKTMLLGAKVIDTKLNWSFGNGHLVLVGDFFDRGLNVTECLWLVYKLETEATKAGGMVHFIIGNHELLNMYGYTQYVRNKYLANADVLGDAYSDLYASNTELGRWLRSKNAVERIGTYLFCHGGISAELAQTDLSLFDINDLARLHYGVAEKFISEPRAKAIFDVHTGIFWFRGAARNRVSPEDIDKALAFAGAEHMVVGHTLMPDIMALYDGKVICVDLYHDENLRMGQMKTLYIERGTPYSLDSEGIKSSLYTVMFSGN
ncbi:MAG: metallophosphoesterase [Lewinellaceae bacterium]|nr:metallophosphoesterase [Lewinellaceae bacterium]